MFSEKNARFFGFLLIFQRSLLLTMKFAGSSTMDASTGKFGNCRNFSRWMANLPANLHSVPLTNLAIPGSHDSCSYSISKTSYYSMGLDEKAKQILRYMDTGSAKDMVYRWSVTQSLDILGQLKSGIRYLDLRVAYNESNGNMYVVHGLTGERFQNVLKQVKKFVTRYPNEVILMDLNHFYVGKAKNKLPEKILFMQVNKYLGEHLCGRTNLSNLTLNYLWQTNKQIVLFLPTTNEYQLPTYVWPRTSIASPFDTNLFQDSENWITFLTQNYNSGRSKNMFYVTQGIMQPHWVEVLTGLAVNATLKSWIAQTANPILVQWMKGKKNGPNGINIVIADFIDSYDFVPTVLALNNKATSTFLCSTTELISILLLSFLAFFC